MIIQKNRLNKFKSEFQCDMCKSKIEGKERMAIYTSQNSNTSKKKWDFCPKCYRIVERSVENYHKRKEKKNDT